MEDGKDDTGNFCTSGTDKLKEALTALGLKSGGTPQQRAERLWLTKATPLEKLDRKHFAKTSAAAKTPAEIEKLQRIAKEIALLEAKVRFFVAVECIIGSECY